ncbi:MULTISPECIES: response regulator transcription factor [Chryseobacterium]|uniref:DNA-binding response OmpR family regulator n=1 Tax=Chryseobacterium camelliae TaxID=1265445 RepID=A0ABU0TI87_9FLAO|nr:MULTISPECIES: response regulator [Chryseobacterium]MDT3409368.1 DNA-binding response OmpR family regulator [Pseudacidovorax intermedius]MDQ1096767.1 DNA-binding response OmpR family regulator [Chryseobacterium camelliae]MDQ1100710.1 DNA-binding response OmpR family regulator [Chryseobacterium sp. SORGH_AS_1048]MDR6088049.1 DNA-binding response OmpR family regulator [Chryseobacterium sp. SORGH_AS_0909]MDR6132423.1 DNA-binding response OmpR family regulator [Chryseobacterium sp. SORGH_AS_1175
MNKNICVLEDSEDILELIHMVLEQDYQVYGFPTVSEFMAGHSEANPDLFLLDVMLPDGNGIEVCNILKKNDASKHIPVIIMTANAGIESMKQLCSADDFVSKPFDIDDLINRIAVQIQN